MQFIYFHSVDRNLVANGRKRIKNNIENIFIVEGKALAKVDFIFCSDEYLLQINKNFLKHDCYTDIITFPLSEKDQPILAEVYISLDRVKENAVFHNVSRFDETLRVLFHGVLHLCGYLDNTKKHQLIMRNKEDFYINLFHVKL